MLPIVASRLFVFFKPGKDVRSRLVLEDFTAHMSNNRETQSRVVSRNGLAKT